MADQRTNHMRKTTTLPDRGDMLRRLETIDDDPHARKNLFPNILEKAGNELNGPGVVIMLTLAISDYTQGLPPAMVGVMHLRVPQLVKALVDDEEVQGDALRFAEDMNATR